MDRDERIVRLDNNRDFGKELGLFHELAITGRKAQVNSSAYTMLSQSVEWFARFGKLLEHLNALREAKVPLAPVPIEKVDQFMAKIRPIINAGRHQSIGSDHGSRYAVAHLYVPKEVTEKDAQTWKDMTPHAKEEQQRMKAIGYKGYFFKMLAEGIRDIGLHMKEVALLVPIKYHRDPSDHSFYLAEDADISGEQFEKALRRLVGQRNLLVEIETHMTALLA
jgi:uncharacterized protein YutE (UPF0331/DUF86 family)